MAAARLARCLLARVSVPRALFRGRREDFLPQRLELVLQEVELELGGGRFTAQLGNLDAERCDGFLLADDGFLEEKSGLLEGVNVPDLLQPWHAQ